MPLRRVGTRLEVTTGGWRRRRRRRRSNDGPHRRAAVLANAQSAGHGPQFFCFRGNDRKHARRLQYITGHGSKGGLPTDIDWRSFADPATTTAIYMPVKTFAVLAARAIAEGLDPATPALAVARATRPDQVVVAGTITDLPARLRKETLPGPVLVLIGGIFQQQVRIAPERETEEVAAG